MATPKIELIVAVKRESFREIATMVTSGIIAYEQTLAQVPPWSRITPLELDIWHGPNEAPDDADGYELYLSYANIAQLDDIEAFRSRHIWGAVRQWRAFGTPANMLQMFDHEELDWFNPETKINASLDTLTQVLGYVIGGMSLQNNLAVKILGTFFYRVDYIQRTFGDDNYTWTSADEMNNGLLMMESDDVDEDGDGN